MVHEELNEVKRIARAAGAILLRYYCALETIEWKSPGDPVTVADREASDLIVRELEGLFPDDAILSEELPDHDARLTRSRVWMIDPMDGTREFIDHREDFAVQIGLTIDGTPTLGVVYQPTADKLYYADRAKGAFLERGGEVTGLQVSNESSASRLTMAMSRSHRSGRVDRIANEPQPETLVTTRLRRELTTAAEDAVTLDDAIASAVRALHQLRPIRQEDGQ